MELDIIPVTKENRSMVEALEVFPNQKNFIESVKECLEEADLLKEWNPVCISDRGILVGFAMYGDLCEEEYSGVWFDRLLIDQKYQGQGYGKRALEIILKEMRKQYPNKDIYLSVYEENQIAISLYKSHGFRFSGKTDTKGEKIMILTREPIQKP